MLDNIKLITLEELKRGNKICNDKELYNILSQRLGIEKIQQSWRSIISWWQNLNRIVFPNLDQKCEEIIIFHDGNITEKYQGIWKLSQHALSTIEVDIACHYLQSRYGKSLNHKTPFISFTANELGVEYRFTIQIIKKWLLINIKYSLG